MRGMIATKRCPPAEGLIATGTYYLRQRERKLGEESLQVFELPNHQGYHLQSSLVLQWPLLHTQRVTLELDPAWRYRSARIELEAEKHLTLARYQIEGHRLRAQTEAAGRRPSETTLPWKDSLLDYPSALFAFALCKKLTLVPGDSETINLVRIALPSLELEQHAYTCARLFDHQATYDIGTFSVREFVIQSRAEELVHAWIEDAGMPVRLERHEHGELIRFELVRYRLFRY